MIFSGPALNRLKCGGSLSTIRNIMPEYARLICCEKDRKWASWIRSALTSDVPIIHCTSLEDCRTELMQDEYSRRAFVLLEATESNATEVGNFLLATSDACAETRFVVAANRSLRRFRSAWIVAGAVFVVFGYDHLLQATKIADRYFDRLERPQINYRKQVVDRIPW